jgi:hypothetical protein
LWCIYFISKDAKCWVLRMLQVRCVWYGRVSDILLEGLNPRDPIPWYLSWRLLYSLFSIFTHLASFFVILCFTQHLLSFCHWLRYIEGVVLQSRMLQSKVQFWLSGTYWDVVSAKISVQCSQYSAFRKSLCTYKRRWQWCPRAPVQAWTHLILFVNTFCRSACEMFLMNAVIAVFNSVSVRGRSRYTDNQIYVP